MDPTLLAIVAAGLAFLAVAGIGFVFAGAGPNSAKTVKRAKALAAGVRLERSARAATKGVANDPVARRKQILKGLKEHERQQRKATATLDSRLRQAGLTISTRTFWLISVVVGVLAMVVGIVIGQPLIALGMGFAAGAGLPRWVIKFLGQRRTNKFTSDFSDALDIIVRGIKSGLPVHDALKIIGRESPEPLGGEFRRLVENIGMGMPLDQALEKMFESMPTSELRFFAIVMAIQSKTGGNLAEALGNLSVVLRSRKLMREKIKALSSEATASAMIIGALPPGVVVLISITQPKYMAVMYSDPRGNLMLLAGVAMMATGIFVMRKMINFKF